MQHPLREVSRQYNAFTHLQKVDSGVRFTSGGGNRYDYWRIAWNQFLDHPLDGVGAGNFDRTYFLERRTDEDVRQAHSIELQTLGETGLVGALALAAFLGAVLAGLWRRAAQARRQGPSAGAGLTVAAGGMFIVWLAQTSVDWLHLIPGLTGAALGARVPCCCCRPPNGRSSSAPAPAAVARHRRRAGSRGWSDRPDWPTHLGRVPAHRSPGPGPHPTRAGRSPPPRNRSRSIRNRCRVTTWRRRRWPAGPVQASQSGARRGDRAEPHNYVSWALLGDLTTRHGDIPAAMRAYARASSLNPRDRELELLGTRRGLIVRLHRNPDAAAALLETGG